MEAIGRRTDANEHDAVIVGASLAGSVAALALGRAGLRVALVERKPDPRAHKRICSHLIQSSAVPTLERLGLMPALLEAGAVRSSLRVWTRWGWVASAPGDVPQALNLRREKLDPLLRDAACAQPGVEPLLGFSAERLERDADGRVRGIVVRARDGEERTLRAPLTIGADGRGSRVAELAGAPRRETPHGRFAYGAYFEGPRPAHAPDASVWMLDPQWAAAFPTDDGLTFYAAMPTKERLPEFRRDPGAALVAFLADLPDPPPILGARRVAPVLGKLDMPNVEHDPVGPGLALIGDAALATDPLWGIGCGWAIQSAEWLAEAVAAPLAGGAAVRDAALDVALADYRRTWRRALVPHARVIETLAGGRRMNAGERFVFAAGARDPRVAALIEEVGSRRMSPQRFLPAALPRAVRANVRHALAGMRTERVAGAASAAAGEVR